MLRSWIIAMKWEGWTPTKYSVLCEKHFKPEDYVCNGKQVVEGQTKKYLKKDAVPPIFDFPAHLVKATTSRNMPKKRKAPPAPKKASPAKKKRNNPVRCDHGSYTKSPRTVINKFKKTLKGKNRRIKSLSAKNLRKEKTIKGLVQKLEK